MHKGLTQALPHHSYDSKFASSYYYRFGSFQHFGEGKEFIYREEI